MEIREAITKYLSLPNMGILDEGIFYNVLKDLNAFEQIPASQHIMKAFITKGYLKDIWNGKKGWQIQSRYYLVEKLGFQPDKVNIVINEMEEGFRNITCDTFHKETNITKASCNGMSSDVSIQSCKKNQKEGKSLNPRKYHAYFSSCLVSFLITSFTCSAFCMIHYQEWSFSQALFFVLGDYLYLFFLAISNTLVKDRNYNIIKAANVAACCLILGIKSILPFWYEDNISEFATTALMINCFLLCALSIVGITTDKKYISTVSWKWTFFSTAIIYVIICTGGLHLLYKQFQ